jgi:hypothetical protein
LKLKEFTFSRPARARRQLYFNFPSTREGEEMKEAGEIILYKKEQKAIERLQKVLATFPKTLKLFAWSGSLCVFKEDCEETDCLIDELSCSCEIDGGDPDGINQDPDITYK